MATKKKNSKKQDTLPKNWDALKATLKLTPEQDSALDNETEALKVAASEGSRLALGKHLTSIRDIIVGGKKLNPKDVKAEEKQKWAAFLEAFDLKGVSRSSTYVYMSAWQEASKEFNQPFLDALMRTGYAIGLAPTPDKPLGKYTEAAKRQPNTKKNAKDVTDDIALGEVYGLDKTLKVVSKEQREAKEAEEGAKKYEDFALEAEQAVHDFAYNQIVALSNKKVKKTGHQMSIEEIEDICKSIMYTVRDDLKEAFKREPEQEAGVAPTLVKSGQEAAA